jgi:DNA-binding NarL/FixJ family response regulator
VSVARGEVITVVLCDDVPQLRRLLRLAFEEQDDLQVVAEAGDGRAGVDPIGALLPDAVVLDLSMPGMDGLEAIPQIRSASPTTAIVVFSGFTAERMADEALALGADRYLEKGVDLGTLVAVVREVVGARRVA